MQRLLILVYGLVAYVVFFATICYAIGFVGNYAVPQGIDHGAEGSLMLAVLVNSTLLGAFAIQHTIMARRGVEHRTSGDCNGPDRLLLLRLVYGVLCVFPDNHFDLFGLRQNYRAWRNIEYRPV